VARDDDRDRNRNRSEPRQPGPVAESPRQADSVKLSRSRG
jgi:hypothetical protein